MTGQTHSWLDISVCELGLMHQTQSSQHLPYNILGLFLCESAHALDIFIQIAVFAILHCCVQSSRAFVPSIELDEEMRVL